MFCSTFEAGIKVRDEFANGETTLQLPAGNGRFGAFAVDDSTCQDASRRRAHLRAGRTREMIGLPSPDERLLVPSAGFCSRRVQGCKKKKTALRAAKILDDALRFKVIHSQLIYCTCIIYIYLSIDKRKSCTICQKKIILLHRTKSYKRSSIVFDLLIYADFYTLLSFRFMVRFHLTLTIFVKCLSTSRGSLDFLTLSIRTVLPF